MKIIDLHCDTITLMLKKLQNGEQVSLNKNELHIDIDKLCKGDYTLQNFAIFTALKEEVNVKKHVSDAIDLYNQEMQANKKIIKQIYSYKDIIENQNNGIISSMLTIEEGDIVDDIIDLKELYNKGVRMIAPMWNCINRIGMPAVINQTDGLTPYGKDYIKEMDRLSIIIDVSHMNDQCILEVSKITTKPFVATHSNARKITNVPRNLPDDLIQLIDKQRGVVGINFYDRFLNGSTIKNIIKHIDHIVSIASINVVALGSDFDGIDGYTQISNGSKMQDLINALLDHGYTNEDVEKIAYKNILRVYKEVLK